LWRIVEVPICEAEEEEEPVMQGKEGGRFEAEGVGVVPADEVPDALNNEDEDEDEVEAALDVPVVVAEIGVIV
jgi:hypothetical protein